LRVNEKEIFNSKIKFQNKNQINHVQHGYRLFFIVQSPSQFVKKMKKSSWSNWWERLT